MKETKLDLTTYLKSSLLVSASAGTGKTHNLKLRIKALRDHLVSRKDGDLSNLLVLTFTKAAASEMYERIKGEFGLREIGEMMSASIQTFDAFFSDIYRQYAGEIGLHHDYHNINAAIYRAKKQELFLEFLNDDIKANNAAARRVLQEFVHGIDVKELMQEVMNLDSYLEGEIDYAKSAKAYLSRLKDQELVRDLLNNYLKKAAETLHERIQTFTQVKGKDPQLHAYQLSLKALQGPVEEIFDYFKNYEPTFGLAATFLEKEAAEKVYNKTGLIYRLKQLLLPFKTLDDVIKAHLSIFECYEYLVTTLIKVETMLLNERKKRLTFTFKDIAFFAYQLITGNEVVRNALKRQYHYILIDEYQDTSEIQEAIIDALSANNVFYVGDIKQAIYLFRNARKEIFLKRFNEYGSNDSGTLVTLTDNYRSREEVLVFANDLFSSLMTLKRTGFSYYDHHQVRMKHQGFTSSGAASLSNSSYLPKICFYDTKDDSDLSTLVVQDIIRKLNTGFEVYDEKLKAFRAVRFSDFALLAPTRTAYPKYLKAFEVAGIPLATDYSIKISPENFLMELLLALIRLVILEIDLKNKEFRYYFYLVARSFLFLYDDGYIYHLLADQKLLEADQLTAYLRSLKTFSAFNDVALTVSEIIAVFKLQEKLIQSDDYLKSSAIMDFFILEAASFKAMNLGLSAFYEYFETSFKSEIDFEIDAVSYQEDAVQLLTIHKSKGLEYKIVYLVELQSQMNVGKSLPLIPGFGALLNHLGPTGETNLLHHIAKTEMMELKIDEMLRLLYVAVTRAKETLVIYLPFHDDIDHINVPLNPKSLADYLLVYLDAKPKSGIFVEEIAKNIPVVFTTTSQDKSESKTPVIFKDLVLDEDVSLYSKRVTTKTKDILLKGTNYHQLLEQYDFKVRRLDYILNSDDREVIKKLVTLPIFASSGEFLKEYRFIDAAGNEGIIDLLIIEADVIKIIDYKTKELDDSSYVAQVLAYVEAIKNKTKNQKRIEGYLLSILNGVLKRVV
ncbi:MAG: UvrD-helicase domain-containing protein [Erysipelotrichaceae bacterium]|jgi:ATP-dependent helicase/nuclease subunit A|nr:UvrD-helicase domain-containing protein [Erysipelotrichaceae bacterium]